MRESFRSSSNSSSAYATAVTPVEPRDGAGAPSWYWGVLAGAITGGLVGWVTVFSRSVEVVRAESFWVESTKSRHGSNQSAHRRTGASVVATDSPVVATDSPVVATDSPVVATDSPVVATGQPKIPKNDRDAPTRIAERDSSESEESRCGDAMRFVEGEYCATVVHHCLEPFEDSSGRCRRYAPRSQCFPPKLNLRFCIDKYEYPNIVGEKPTVMVDFNEATAACAKAGKRLCTAREWTLACEGPSRLPYPYGYVRDAEACNIDRPHRFPDEAALSNPKKREAELHRIDDRSSAGARPKCVSPFGVFDMTGNVDEWVIPDGPEEPAGLNSRTALKGGYYGIVRARCRPSTTSHGPTFEFYQVGFRCCSDVADVDRH